MNLKKKNDVTNKTVNAVEKKSRIKKVIAIILAILLMFCLLCEISTFTLYAVPMIGIQMFQMTGIGIENGLTLANFTVSDCSVMIMMWLAPFVFFVGISIWVHCKLIKFVCKKMISWLKIIFSKPKKD